MTTTIYTFGTAPNGIIKINFMHYQLKFEIQTITKKADQLLSQTAFLQIKALQWRSAADLIWIIPIPEQS